MDSAPRQPRQAKPLFFTGSRASIVSIVATALALAAGLAVRAQSTAPATVAPVGAKTRRPLIFLDDRDYPPHSFLENGVAKGSEIEVASALARVLGRPVRVNLEPWSQAQDEVQRGDADALLDFSITNERRKTWDFSAPIFTHDFGLFVRSDEMSILGLDSLGGKRVGVVRGGFPSEYLTFVPGVSLVPFETYDEGFNELTLSAVDAVAADTWVGAYAMQRRGIKGVAMVGEPFATRQAGIAVRKGNDELLAEINAAIATLSADGTLAAIHDRWRPQEYVFVSRASVNRYVMWLAAAFAVIVGVALALWIVTLKRQIRKREVVERQLAESRERLSVAVDAAELGTWRWTAATGIADRDAKLSEMVGQPGTPAQTLEQWMQTVHPDDRASAEAAMAKTMKGPSTVDFRIIRPGGEIRWLRSQGRPYFDAEGSLSYVTGASFDITDLKTAEAALRLSEEHFAKAFLASPATITISDFETGIIAVSDRFEDITGYRREEVLGKTLFEAGMIADNARRDDLMELLRRDGSVRDFVFRIRRKDGAIRTLSLSAAMLEIGGQLRFLSFATDITDQRRLEASLQHASEINRLLVSELETGPLYEAIMRSVGGALPVDYVGLLQCEGSGKPLDLKASVYHDASGVVAATPKAWDDRGPATEALGRGEIVVFDRRHLSAFDPTTTTLLADGFQFLCCAPLSGRLGPVGVLTLGSRNASGFSSDDLAVVKQLSTYVGIAIKNAQTYDEVQVLKNHLTEERLYLQEEIRVDHNFEDIIGASPALMRVLSQIETVAPTDSTVLLLGETGTGKELLARAIHDRSQRRDRTFVRVNAAALPATLLESELFGYERGAFTGAAGTKVGRFELAHLGSMFLDEVGDIPIEIQPKLLRVLQEREFERLGGTRVQRVDVRLIAATNRDLDVMTNEGSFRRDLFYRLNVFPIHVPPLRDRPEDIPLLVRHFVRRFSTKLKRRIDTIPAGTMAGLTRWHWPGNIRELENVIERAVIISQSPVLQVSMADLTPAADAPMTAAIWSAGAVTPPTSGESTLADAEREQILRALRASNGIIAGEGGAAARLGLKRTTLQSKMRKLGINRPSF